MSEVFEFGVLGGGLCGLLVGEELRRRGRSFLVLEKEREPGGLARTLHVGGVPVDMGPHALYSRNPAVMDYLRSLPLRYHEHHRKVRVAHHGSDGRIHEVDYPFENGLGDLPLLERVECLEGYMLALLQKRSGYANLRDWIDNGLGYGIARHFMIPYNSKIWNAPLSQVSMDLVNKKIEPAPVRVIIESTLGIRSVGRKFQSVFLYPRGGIGALARVLAKAIAPALLLDAPVLGVRREKNGYLVETGQGPRRFRRLISTIPLKDFLALQPFKALRAHQRSLVHNDTLFVSVALKPRRRFKRFADCHWLFFAGPEIFYRISMMHIFCRSSVHHLVAEITCKGARDNHWIRQMHKRVLKDLVKVGILDSQADVDNIDSRLVPYTYPIPTISLSKIQARLDAEFAEKGIHLLGRNGHWDYLNMDQLVEKVWGFFARFPKRRAQA